jgi:DNA polymerase kappa
MRGMAQTGVARSTVSVSERQSAVSRKPRSGPSGQHERRDAGRTAPKSPPDYAGARVESTTTMTTRPTSDGAGECPLCTRSFADNDELNAHVDWCLSREAIRSAQVEGDGRERGKKPTADSVRHTKEWWKGGPVEGSQKPKRRKLEE